jgi:ribosomal protein S3
VQESLCQRRHIIAFKRSLQANESQISYLQKKPISGFKISIKGRLNGIKRTRKVTTTYKGVSPNTICSAIKQYQLPIYTK